MDFITQLPESQGQTQIMVVVDRFTKMAHFIGLRTNASAKDVADTFLKEVWKLERAPVSNRIGHGRKVVGRILGIIVESIRN